jgi:hypothetical protein
MSRKTSLAGIAGLTLAILGGYEIWKHLPPYERGLHDAVVQAGTSPERADVPHIGPCPVYPADSVWNTPIDSLPKDRRSDDYIDNIGGSRGMHADFGSNLNTGLPYSELPPGTRKVKIDFDYHEESDLGNYPIPPGVPIEGGAAAGGDRHVILIDTQRCLLYELFDAHPLAEGNWHAGSGVKVDLTGNALRPDGWGSADAAGMTIFPGLVRYDEVTAGAINHALRFTVRQTRNTHIWPARHKASMIADLSAPAMGTRFRLRADFDISKFSRNNQVILRALKKYGMFVADNGGDMFLSGVPDKRWDDVDLHKLGDVKAQDFEAVDESDLQLLADSGRVDPVALKK